MIRRARIFRRTMMVLSVLLFPARAIMWLRSFWVADEWIKRRVFDEGDAHLMRDVTLASDWRSLAFQVRRFRFLIDRPGGTVRHELPSFIPKDSGEEAMRQDFPVGDYFSHNTYGAGANGPRIFRGVGLLGFLWEREISDPEKPPEGRIVNGWKSTRYIMSFTTIGNHSYTGETDTTTIAVPCWFLGAIFAAAPLFANFRRIRASRIRPPGMCVKCGYDLRGSPDRCPECGTVVGTGSLNRK